jgi:hypothetical protein
MEVDIMEENKNKQKEMYDVEYDMDDVQVLSVDGALVDIGEEIGRLLFFHELPVVEIQRENVAKQHFRKKCKVELRMTASQLREVAKLIAIQILCFESEKQQTVVRNQETAPQTMFA